MTTGQRPLYEPAKLAGAGSLLQRSVLDSTSFSIIATDWDGAIISFNAAAEQMLGYRSEEVLGKSAATLFHVPQELAARSAELAVQLGRPIGPGFETLVALARERKVDEREWTYVRKDRTYFPVVLRVMAIQDDQGVVSGFLGVAQDISKQSQIARALQASEERLQQVLRQADCLVWEAQVTVSDADWNWRMTVHPSGMYARLTGASQPTQAGLWYQFEIPEQAEMNARAREAMISGAKEYAQEFRVMKGRTPIWIRESVSISRPDKDHYWLVGIATDITASKAISVALQQSEERTRFFAEYAPAAVAMFDREMRYVVLSAKWLKDYGLEGQHIIGRRHYDIFPDITEKRKAVHQRCLAGATEVSEAELFEGKDGQRKWLSWRVQPWHEATGEIGGIVIFTEDITAQRNASAMLTLSEERFRRLSDSSPVGVYEIDLAGACNYVNPKWCEIAGISAEEARGHGFLKSLHPADRAGLRIQWEAASTARRDFVHEFRFLRADGSIRWVRSRATPLRDAQGLCIGYVGSNEDITGHKRAALVLEQQKFALDQHAIVTITDTRGTITYVNDLFCQISGYLQDEFLGNNHRILNSGHHSREFFEDMFRTIAAGQVWHADLCNRSKSGELFWVATTIIPLKNEAGKVEQYIAIRADISAQKRVEEQLKVARDQALEASRMKSEFLATMSHEIRTPMNAVIGMAGLLIETPLDEEQREMTRTIMGGAEALLAIINDILDFSRIEAGKMRIDLSEFNFTKVVEDTISFLAARAHEKQIELICEVLPWSGATLCGDSGRVRQVLINLIGNAIKFTEKGEVLVTVQTVFETEAVTRLRVAVRDTGIGISRAAQVLLFQPFVQADGSTTRKFGGTGLGLAISRQLVELMDGEIGFESEEGKGSLFWIELSFGRKGPAPSEPPFSLAPGKRILVVDDSETNRRIMLGQLENLGVQAEAVGDGQAALVRLRDPSSDPWDLVLLDANMPGLKGMELAALIQSDRTLGTLPLVMLSTSGQLAGENGSNVKFARILTKPVLDSQLKHCLLQVLGPAPLGLPLVKERKKRDAFVGLNLLLIEDNLANQRVATMMLTRMGCTVEVAENGLVGIARMSNKSYDAVLMDCQMPVLDGYETTRRIRAGKEPGVNSKVPIIAMTAYARAEDHARCLSAGMDDYVSKPIREVELVAALARRGFTPSPAKPLGKPTPDEKIFDLTTLETVRSLLDERGQSLLPILLEMYLSDEIERLIQLERAIGERNAVELAEQAHSFGGTAASMGGVAVRRVALELEAVARSGDWVAAKERMAELRQACSALKEEIYRLKLVPPGMTLLG